MTFRWTPDDVKDLITNPVYAGMGPIPPIVEDETWLKANVEMAKGEGVSATVEGILDRFQETFPQFRPPDPEAYVQQAERDVEAALRRVLNDLRELFDQSEGA